MSATLKADFLHGSWDRLPLEIVVTPDGRRRVLWNGKPLAGAEVVQTVPGRKDPLTGETGKDGFVPVARPDGPGTYGIRVLYKEAREGEHGGKKYKEVRHYATFTLALGREAGKADKSDPPAKTDPEATKLLADARAARLIYHDFPGFTADAEVNIDGKVTRGRVDVSAKGKVSVQMDDEAAAGWARQTLGSVVAHRLDSGTGDGDTPCAFVDEDKDNPLGRAIRVLNDEFHSSYRIRDRQVIVVNRRMKESRFTITVLENHRTADKKFVPSCYVVNTWDLKTDALVNSQAHHQTWSRVGAFDLPHRTLVVTATAGKQEARSVTLSNYRLNK